MTATTKKAPAIAAELPKLVASGINQFGMMYLFYDIQRRYGARFSEVISITPRNIVDPQTLFLKGAKGSNDLYVYAPDIIQYIWSRHSLKLDQRIFQFNYTQYRRFLLKINAFERPPGNKRLRISHLPRSRIFQSRVDHAGRPTESISRSQGQRSNKSILYYLRPDQRAQSTQTQTQKKEVQ